MPRDLADVLHYFLPELDDDPQPAADSEPGEPATVAARDAARGAAETAAGLAAPIEAPPDEPPAATRSPRSRAIETPPPLPILGIPSADRDVVRAALIWNLAVETARLGGRAIVLAPAVDEDSPLWPAPGTGPLGAELQLSPVHDLAELGRAAKALASDRGRRTRQGGAIFVRVPIQWIEADGPRSDVIDWWLVLTTAHRRDLAAATELAAAIDDRVERAEIGATIHGVSSIGEARGAFEHLARRCRDQRGLDLRSYGLLVDDLHVYRAIASQRPIGLAHPQAPATRALMDVASMLYEDARSRVLG